MNSHLYVMVWTERHNGGDIKTESLRTKIQKEHKVKRKGYKVKPQSVIKTHLLRVAIDLVLPYYFSPLVGKCADITSRRSPPRLR